MDDLNMILLFADTGKLKSQGIYRTEGKMVPEAVQYEGIEVKKDRAVTNNGKAQFDISIEKKFFLDRVVRGVFLVFLGVGILSMLGVRQS